jgi:hypothetical protein
MDRGPSAAGAKAGAAAANTAAGREAGWWKHPPPPPAAAAGKDWPWVATCECSAGRQRVRAGGLLQRMHCWLHGHGKARISVGCGAAGLLLVIPEQTSGGCCWRPCQCSGTHPAPRKWASRALCCFSLEAGWCSCRWCVHAVSRVRLHMQAPAVLQGSCLAVPQSRVVRAAR